MPPPAEGLITRFVVGPALRAQPDGRLVTLVRDGYEAAFEEIVRRYGHPLRRYAAAIVGGSADDVTQDALSKAFLALRRDDREIELRPWLYRIIRNTALNDLRDRPPQGSELHDGIEGRSGVAEEVERREEIDELLSRLGALPEPQRAAIVMRELEGLGHDEIASALGISGGAARQAIHRARTALRDGFGMAIPLPLLKLMLEGGATAEFAAGGAGAGVALKAATATVLVAGTLGAGLALHDGHSDTGTHSGSAGAGSSGPGRLATTSDGGADAAFHDVSNPQTEGSSGRDGGSNGHSKSNSGGQDGGSIHSGSHETSEGGSSGPRPGPGGDGSGSGDDTSGEPRDSGSESSGGGQDGGEISTSGDGSESNSGPGSGGEEDVLGSELDGSRDSGDGGGFSEQMEAQTTQEDR